MSANPDIGTRLRYGLGKSAVMTLDYLLAHRLFPFAARFPVGVRFCHDLSRFLGDGPTMIIDVGANVGQSALAFSAYWPQATIHSFEPVLATFSELTQRCISRPRIYCHQCALGDSPGEIRIKLHENSELNSLLAESDSSVAGTSELVKVRRLDEFASRHGLGHIDLLKIDAEGFELHILDGAATLLRERKVRAVYAECRFLRNHTRQVLFEELDRQLTGWGFLFSGFYQMYRWGPAKRFAAFADGLWLLDLELPAIQKGIIVDSHG